VQLLFDKNDLPNSRRLRDVRFTWLSDLGAEEISGLPLDTAGFLFGYENGATHYQQLVGDRPNVRDRPDERQELIFLPDILHRIEQAGFDIPRPKTWVIGVDESPADDLEFPLFVRTPKSSWKRGGSQSRVNNLKELSDEMDLLRRTFGWDTPILARKWIDAAVAGNWMFGNAPQEIRVWIVDRQPKAWSFHYLHVVPEPEGFPPQAADLALLSTWAGEIGLVFRSRLVCADFIRDRQGGWHFLEAGPGAVCGTAHEGVFKFVANALCGNAAAIEGDAVGGPL
jgi:hypothetical protein